VNLSSVFLLQLPNFSLSFFFFFFFFYYLFLLLGETGLTSIVNKRARRTRKRKRSMARKNRGGAKERNVRGRKAVRAAAIVWEGNFNRTASLF